MQSIRQTILALTATLLAFVVGTGTALADPKPLPTSDAGFISPEAPATSSGGASGGFLDSWPQVTLAILVVAAVLAIAVVGVSRLHHHKPATA
jgi:hypothetical protein